MKGKNLTIFIRFGGLNVKKQKGYSVDEQNLSYHTPPAPKGLYAMPKIAQEFFLIGAMCEYQPGVVPKSPNIDYDNTSDEEQEKIWNAYNKRYKKSISSMRKEFVKTKGEIWHHLEEYADLNEIISRHGSWVKTSIHAWQKAFSKMSLKLRYFGVKNINEAKGILGYYSKDHCEVFFDEKI